MMQAPVMVETVAVPLGVEKVRPTLSENNNDENNTGFPFDDSDFGDRDRSFRSHIDDIVKRHPELAEHLNFDKHFDSFPFRSNTWGHKRRGSSSSSDEARPSSSAEHPEGRRFRRPFGSRFEEAFGFPFSKTFDGEPEHRQQQSSPPPKPQQQPETPQESKLEDKVAEKPPQVPASERSRRPNPHIPQSSTVDLGQKQDPVSDSRGQRSMSAPPENRQQRFVSSINIPIQSGGGGDAAAQQPNPPQQRQQPQQPQPQPSQTNKMNERVIPIHVEGRDEPVIPKRANQTFSQPQPQPERVFSSPQPERVFTSPQPEKVFGQRPGGFGHWDRSQSPYYSGEFFPSDIGDQYFEGAPQFFMNRGEPHQRRPNPEEYFAGPFRQQQTHQRQPQQKPQQPPQMPQQQPQPQQQQPQQQQHQQYQHQQQQQQQQPPQQQQTAPPQPPPQPKGPIEQIHCIQKDVLQLMDQVEKFNGKPKDKQYLYLDEMLTRNLLKLDDVETEGKENIRQARKEAIKCIQKCISILEAKAAANEQLRNELMEVDTKLENPISAEPQPEPEAEAIAAPETEAAAAPTTEPIPLTSLEVSGVDRPGMQVAADEQDTEDQQQADKAEEVTPMEVSPPDASSGNAAVAAEAQELEQEKKNATEESVITPTGDKTKEVESAAPSNEEKGENAAQQSEAAESASQPAETVKEEAKDKKEKKKVKKKATTDKPEAVA